MQRTALFVALAFVAGLATAVVPAQAQDAPSTAVCAQVPNTPNGLDDAFVTAFMNEQLATGRANFQPVSGMSTVLCAW